MGIWDAISWTTDSLKRNTPDLTAWCPSSDSLKRIVPDATAVKKLGSSAVTKVDGAVRGNMGWSKIAQVGTIVAKHATHEALKLIPCGSAVYKVCSRSIRDLTNNSNKQETDVRALQAKLLRLDKEFSEYKKELNKPSAELTEKKSPSVANIHSSVSQEAEDETRDFMMQAFISRL